MKEAHVLVSVISSFKVLSTAGCPSLPTLGNNSCSVGVKAEATGHQVLRLQISMHQRRFQPRLVNSRIVISGLVNFLSK